MIDESRRTRAKGGRPRATEDALRGKVIGVRVSESEFSAIVEKAKIAGMQRGRWLREAALTRKLPPPPVPAVNIQKYGELGKLTGILNQLAKAANQGRILGVKPEDFARVKNEVDALRRDLMGLKKGDV